MKYAFAICKNKAYLVLSFGDTKTKAIFMLIAGMSYAIGQIRYRSQSPYHRETNTVLISIGKLSRQTFSFIDGRS